MLKHHKRKVLLANALCVFFAIVILLVFYFIYMSREHFKQEISPNLFANISARVMLIPEGAEIKKQYDRAFEDKIITYSEYYALNSALDDYIGNISTQINKSLPTNDKINAYEKAVENLKAFDEVGYELVDPSKRREVRDLLVKHIDDEKLKMKN